MSTVKQVLTGWAGPLVIGVAGIGFILASPGWSATYWGATVGLALIYSVVILSVTLLAGWNGRWSLGHAGFLAVGAFAAAELFDRGIPIEVAVLALGATGALFGLGLGAVARRFSVLYLAIVTMVIALMIGEVLEQMNWLSGGTDGRSVPIPTSLVFGDLSRDGAVILTIVVTATIFAVTAAVRRTHQRFRWLAVSANPIAAESIGISESKEQALGFSAATAGAIVAGVPYAVVLGYITPEAFNFKLAVIFIAASVVGGVGAIAGAVAGAAYVVGLPEVFRSAESLQRVIFGASVIAVLLVYPKGVAPLIGATIQRVSRRGRKASSSDDSDLVPRGADGASIARLFERNGVSTSTSIIELDQLTVRFGGMTALDSVSFTVESGSCLGLVGPNGAGKTTLFNAIGGFVPTYDDSSITVDGRQVLGSGSSHRTGYGIARTFQHAELFTGLTVAQVIELAAVSTHVTGLHSFRARMANAVTPSDDGANGWAHDVIETMGLSSVADREVSTLPFGMQKMVDIARALALKPRFLLMDEPFSGLDPEEVQIVFDVIKALPAAGVGVILIDHAVEEVLALADHVVVLNFGKVLASGDSESIRHNPDVIESYLGSADGNEAKVKQLDDNTNREN